MTAPQAAAATPVDQPARDRIRHDTATTLFVEAGAGSGKTTMLVSRVQTLVVEDGIPINEIAAVTFTERAGSQLRDALRARLEQAARYTTTDIRRARAERALDDLDMAAIGTLHSFAQRLLSEHPIEAGIPPLVEVLDEVASSVAFESRWEQWQRDLLDDPEMAATYQLADAVGITLAHVRSLVTKLNADWDLVDDLVVRPGAPRPVSLPDLAPLLQEARVVAAGSEHCTQDDDKFLPKLTLLDSWADTLEPLGEAQGQLVALRACAHLRWTSGQQGNWSGRLPEIKASCHALQQRAKEIVDQVVEQVLRSIVHWCGVRVLEAAQERRAEGRLEFHDLLVLTRNLLRDNAEVRATLQQRYRRLLLDEFQDTDPIQIEIAVRIAGGATATQAHWEDVAIPDGSLFVVGDPKQSIYRFRRADIGMYLRAQSVVGEQVSLTTNFRTVASILDWVNAVFAELIQHADGAQPHYQALTDWRGTPTVGNAVTIIGAEAHEDGVRAAGLRELEAHDVAQSIVRALDEGWTMFDEATREWRSLRLGDIAILLPARTSLPFLESALDEAGVMYRTESSSLVYHAPEVRDLFAVARAVADPSDAFALVTALRSPLFGCGDDDLWTWKQARGAFHVHAPAPGGQSGHPVALAIAYLGCLHHQSRWLTPSEVLGAIATDRRMFELAVFGPRARDTWRRLRFVIDQARAWSEVQHGGLRSYLTWAAAQSAEGSRVAESVLPESDSDSVRVMTVHAAKGLEFPMVVLSGMSSAPNYSRGVRLFWTPDSYAVQLTKDAQTEDFQAMVPIDEQMSSYERRRLMYVAATRARDHLVVSMHRSGKSGTNAKLLADVGAADAAGAVAFDSDVTGRRTRPAPAIVSPPPELEAWLQTTQASIEASRAVPAHSASGLEGTDPAVGLAATGSVMAEDSAADLPADADQDAVAGTAKGARDMELPAWAKGRYGSAIGRAVHGVLQLVDLATGDGLEDAVAAQCAAEGVVDYAALVTQLVRSVLDSDVVKRAAARPHWRESYVGTVQDEKGTVLEGFVDLIYREDDGSLVIVDYKTDDVPDAALDARVASYAPQVRAYRAILESATTGSIASPALLFSRSDQAATCRQT